jgi:hypothetical protein
MTDATPFPLFVPPSVPTPREVLLAALDILGAAPQAAVEQAVRGYRDTLLATVAADLRLVADIAWSAALLDDPHADCTREAYHAAADYLDKIREATPVEPCGGFVPANPGSRWCRCGQTEALHDWGQATP